MPEEDNVIDHESTCDEDTGACGFLDGMSFIQQAPELDESAIYYIPQRPLADLVSRLSDDGAEITAASVVDLVAPQDLQDDDVLLPADMSVVDGRFEDVHDMIEKLGARGAAEALVGASRRFEWTKQRIPERRRPKPMTVHEYEAAEMRAAAEEIQDVVYVPAKHLDEIRQALERRRHALEVTSEQMAELARQARAAADEPLVPVDLHAVGEGVESLADLQGMIARLGIPGAAAAFVAGADHVQRMPEASSEEKLARNKSLLGGVGVLHVSKSILEGLREALDGPIAKSESLLKASMGQLIEKAEVEADDLMVPISIRTIGMRADSFAELDRLLAEMGTIRVAEAFLQAAQHFERDKELVPEALRPKAMSFAQYRSRRPAMQHPR